MRPHVCDRMFLPSGLGYLKPCLGSACLVNSLSPFASILCVSLFRRNGERIFTQYIKPLPYPCVYLCVWCEWSRHSLTS